MQNINPYLATFLAFTIWSTVGLVVNFTTLQPFQILWAGSLVAFLLTLLIGIFRKSFLIKLEIKHLFFVILLFCSQGLFGLVWFQALTRLDIGTATFIFNLAPLFIILLSPLLIGEKSSRNIIPAVILGLFGLFILFYKVGRNWNEFVSLGALFGLCTAVLGGLGAIATRKIAGSYSLSFIVGLQMLAQIIFSTPFILFTHFEISNLNIFYTIYQGAIGSVLPLYLIAIGFRKLKAATVQTVGYIEPFLATIWGIFFLQQKFSINLILGGVLIVFSNYLLSRKTR